MRLIQTSGPSYNLWSKGEFINGEMGQRDQLGLDTTKTYTLAIFTSVDFSTTQTSWLASPRNSDGSSRGNLFYHSDLIPGGMIRATFSGAASMRITLSTHTGDVYIMIIEGDVTPGRYEPYLPYKFYGDIAIPSRYQPATSSDTTLYPSVLNGCGTKALKDIAKANWSIQSTNNFGVQKTTIGTNSTVLPTNSLRIYSNLRTTDPTGGTGVIWVGNNYINFTNLVSIYTTVDGWYNYCQTSGEIIFYPLATSDGSVWNFVKDIQDNVFGYLNAATSEFVKIYGATGTVSTIISNHYMLANGGTPNGN